MIEVKEGRGEIDNKKIASTIIEMTREAVNSGKKKLYWQALGYVEGMRRSGEFTDMFAEILLITIKDEWSRRKAEKKRLSQKILELTA